MASERDGSGFRPMLRPGARFDESAAGKPLLLFEDVHKAYATGSTVLRGMSLQVDRGEFVFFTGPSGAGKSTVLRMLYAAEEADSGRILFMGRDVGRLRRESIAYLRRNLGVVFQDFCLVNNWTVAQNVSLPLEVLGLDRRRIRSRVSDVLDRVGLGGRGGDLAAVLSGGEQQRVGIARAIVAEPALVLADEPTGNLDPVLALDILGLFEDINETGVTVIFATHDRSLLEARQHRVVVLDDGVARDTPDGIGSSPRQSGGRDPHRAHVA